MDEPLSALRAAAESYAFQLAAINMAAQGALADADPLACLRKGEKEPSVSHGLPPCGG